MVGFFTVYTYRWAFNKDFCHYVNFITNLAVYLGGMLAFSMQAISLCLILNLSKIFFWCWLLPRLFVLYLLIIRGIIKFEYFYRLRDHIIWLKFIYGDDWICLKRIFSRKVSMKIEDVGTNYICAIEAKKKKLCFLRWIY